MPLYDITYQSLYQKCQMPPSAGTLQIDLRAMPEVALADFLANLDPQCLAQR